MRTSDDMTDHAFTRRGLMTGLGAAGLIAPLPLHAADKLTKSLEMAMGPFYPVEKPLDRDADLTRLKGSRARAKGEVIEVAGRVLAADGRPQPGATIELWQCNAAGRYAHRGDHNRAPLDPNFQGYARLTADAEGRYRFLTVKPAAYPAGDFLRSPHIHLDVAGRYKRLVTQLYFPVDAAMLQQDKVLQHDLEQTTEAERASVFAKRLEKAARAEPGADRWVFDIVLAAI